MATVIKRCTCNNEFQDKEYGKGNRVHNTKDKSYKCSCTVCGKER